MNTGNENLRDIKEFEDLSEILRNLHFLKPEALVELAGIVSPKFAMLSLHPQKVIRVLGQVVVFGEAAAEEWLDRHDLTVYDDRFATTKSLLEARTLSRQFTPEEQYKAIASVSSKFAGKLFGHIKPINSRDRKIEAVRIYETIRECREIAAFFSYLRNKHFFPIGEGYLIPFTINFQGRLNGLVDRNGIVRFHSSRDIFFNGLQITKIQQCKICNRLFWIEKGKNNVDKTCSDKCARILKNKKQKEKYALDREYISETRKQVRKTGKRKFGPDKFTERSFKRIFSKNKFLTNLYVVWTETFAFENGGIRRETREHLPEVTISRDSLILDDQIFKRNLPCVFKYRIDAAENEGSAGFLISKQSSFEEKKGSLVFKLIVPHRVFVSLAQYYRDKGQKRLSELWVKAGESSPNGIAKKLTRDDRKIQKRFFNLSYTRSVPNIRKSPSTRIKHYAFLQKCEVLATASVTKAPIITHSRRSYRRLKLIPVCVKIVFIDAKNIF